MTPSRVPIGRNTALGTRERIFETDDAIEVDSTDQYEVSQKRVLFEDIVLVTWHRELGWGYLAAHAFVLTVFIVIAMIVVAGGGGAVGATVVALFGLPSFVAILIRSIFQVDVVSIFGRRSRAKIRFFFRKKRARELYGRICYKTRQIQREVEKLQQLPDDVSSP
jgi:hypothetical protein